MANGISADKDTLPSLAAAQTEIQCRWVMLCGMSQETITEAGLLVVAESLLSRAGLTALLEERGCLALGAVDGSELARDIDRLRPDLLVVDFGWDADAMSERLAQVDKDIPVLALIDAVDDSGLALPAVLRAFPCFGLLPRDSDPDRLVAALAALEAGLTTLDPGMSDVLGASNRGDIPPPADPLTARENEVLQLLARGLTNRAIANELGISQHTVKFHVNAIMSKLDAQSRTEAVVRASQLGMIVL